jgi:GNAT superfamily N-acetyltransferase
LAGNIERWFVVKIRPALSDDAVAACEVLRRSITELCIADHNNDPAILEAWLENKTAEHVRSWIANPGNVMLVATEGEAILAVGAVTAGGEIILNYVSPGARFRGVSKALLKQLEATAAALGNDVCVLTSTVTARSFYQSAGYRADGAAPVASRSGRGVRMTKALR